MDCVSKKLHDAVVAEMDILKNIHGIVGNLVDTVNLSAELDDRIRQLEEPCAIEALESFREWLIQEDVI